MKHDVVEEQSLEIQWYMEYPYPIYLANKESILIPFHPNPTPPITTILSWSDIGNSMHKFILSPNVSHKSILIIPTPNPHSALSFNRERLREKDLVMQL